MHNLVDRIECWPYIVIMTDRESLINSVAMDVLLILREQTGVSGFSDGFMVVRDSAAAIVDEYLTSNANQMVSTGNSVSNKLYEKVMKTLTKCTRQERQQNSNVFRLCAGISAAYVAESV